MANFNNRFENHYNPFLNRSSVDVLASILQHCNSATNRNIMSGISKDKGMTRIAAELRSKVRFFEDLAYADARGLQKLLKLVRPKDLAIALRGAEPAVIQSIASNMSRNTFSDLKQEIDMVRAVTQNEVFEARDRIMAVVSELLALNEMYINKNTKNGFN